MGGRWRGPWREVGDRAWVRRYGFFDQEIGLVLGDGAALLVDTRTTPAQARELLMEVRALTDAPIEAVVNTHAHSDHCFGNATFDPVRIWGQRGAVRFLSETGERQRVELAARFPELAEDLGAVELRPPDALVGSRASLLAGGRRVELAWHGRAHTDHDLVVHLPDAGVAFAGDIVEEGAPPSFGDGYPLDWAATLRAFLADRPATIIVPGHGDVVDRAWVDRQATDIAALADIARAAHAGRLSLDEAIATSPFPPDTAREALARASLQLRGG